MDDTSPDRELTRAVLGRAATLGVALGTIPVAGASLLLAGGPRLLTEAAGLIAMVVVAIGVGMWVGSPGAERDELPMRERWAVAGVTTALAGAFATALRGYDLLGTGTLGRTLGLLLLVGIPVYALGLAVPILLAAGERWEEALGESGSEWGVLGVVVLGVLGGVVAGVVAAGVVLVPTVTAGPVLLVTSIVLLAPLVIPEPEVAEPEEEVLAEVVTPFGSLRVTELTYAGDRQPERRLYLNGEEESAELVRSGAPALAYVAAAETWLTSSTPPASTYLFLGGGAYTLPRRIAERDPRARITVVELDPAVTQLARTYFGLRREHRITSVHGDARAYLTREGEGGRFDRVYVDVYAGDESLPYALVTREAFLAVARQLRPGGVAAMNVIGEVRGPHSARLWSVVRTWASVFPSTALYAHLGPDYPDRQNLLLAGAPDAEQHFPARAGLFERWPAAEWATGPETVVYRDLVD